MGVMACYRVGCENVMCDRLSNKYGYICDECFDELVSLGVTTNVEEFMALEKKERHEKEARGYFESVFSDGR